MQGRLLVLVTLIVLLISLSACKGTETETVVTEAVTGESEEQAPTQNGSTDQAYPVETTPFKPATQAQIAYPITQDDLGHLIKVWNLTAYYIDGAVQETPEKTLEFKSDNTYQIISSDNTTAGTWTARLLAAESNLVFSSSEGNLFSYQITALTADSLILTSIQDGKRLEEHFAPANW